MDTWVIVVYVIIAVLIIAAFIGYRFFRRYLNRKMVEQKTIVNENKQTVSIFVMEKRKGKITSANLPKSVTDQIPVLYKIKKMPLITAKVGPQIVTLICDDDLYDKIPDKKNVNVELAGIFIASIKQQQNTSKAKNKSKRKKR